MVGATGVGRATATGGAVFLGVTRNTENAAAPAAPAKIKPTNHRRDALPVVFSTDERVAEATGACDIVVGISERPPRLRECSVRSSPAMRSTSRQTATSMM